jgi:hypothetical protein
MVFPMVEWLNLGTLAWVNRMEPANKAIQNFLLPTTTNIPWLKAWLKAWLLKASLGPPLQVNLRTAQQLPSKIPRRKSNKVNQVATVITTVATAIASETSSQSSSAARPLQPSQSTITVVINTEMSPPKTP